MSNDIFIIGTIIVSAVVLIVSVLMQKKGGGLGTTFGGSDSGGYMKQRGAEKTIFYVTIVSAIIFVGSIIISLVK